MKDPTKDFKGKIWSVDVSGAGPGSHQLTVNVADSSGSLTAIATLGDPPETADECYPAIFDGFIQLSLTALRINADVQLGYNPALDGESSVIQNITIMSPSSPKKAKKKKPKRPRKDR